MKTNKMIILTEQDHADIQEAILSFMISSNNKEMYYWKDFNELDDAPPKGWTPICFDIVDYGGGNLCSCCSKKMECIFAKERLL